MENFTPGPWTIDPEWRGGTNPIAIYAKQGPIDVCPAMAHGLAEATLIAAAPELYHALADMLRHCERQFSGWPASLGEVECRNRAVASLAKARGD